MYPTRSNFLRYLYECFRTKDSTYEEEPLEFVRYVYSVWATLASS